MGYRISKFDLCKNAQKIFEKLCDDIKNGRYKKSIIDEDGNPLPIEVTPENFKMAYAQLNEDDILYKCRQQLPKYWFVSKEGIVLSLSEDRPKWYNKGNKQGRNDREIQLKINTAATGHFLQKTKDGKEKSVQIYNYTLVAIVYDSLLIGEPEDIENIKKYGLEVFGRKNSGNADQANKENGPKGLVIDGTEVIPPDNMMDVHHTEGTDQLSPDQLEIMPHWLHEYLKYYTATIETAEELHNLIHKNPDASRKIDRMCPNGYIVIDYSKKFTANGEPDKYIHYSGINKERADQVNASEYRYFKIVPLGLENEIDKKRDSIDLSDNVLDAGNRPVIPVEFNTEDGSKEVFYITYVYGNKDGFRTIVKNLGENKEYRDKIGQAFYKKKKDIDTTYVERYDCTVCSMKPIFEK